MIGTSDIHAPDLLEKSTADKHRTMTLVFVKETNARRPQGGTAERSNRCLVRRPDYWQEGMAGTVVQKVGSGRPSTPPLGEQCLRGDPQRVQRRYSARKDERSGPTQLVLPAMTTTLVKVGLERAPGR